MMTVAKLTMSMAAAAIASPAMAEVKSVSAQHFEIESTAVVAATPAQAYAMLGRIGEWWSSAHTYSGSAANLGMDLKAGGCFCERLPGTSGSAEHMRVVYAQPGVMLRVQGGLGPLQGEAVAGTLTWTLKEVADGTLVTQNYIAAGFVRGGMAPLAPLVDGVLAEQLSGLRARIAR
jgi:uncharacterized protein YndB with AHSA1/START domain